jgi:hypothetical protein
MTEFRHIDGGRIAYEVTGDGPLAVLSHVSVTVGGPTGSWPRSWRRPATGWPMRTCAGTEMADMGAAREACT